MELFFSLPIGLTIGVVFALMFVANEIGFRIGRALQAAEPERSLSVGNALKATIFGLVALLLGFSYSMTNSRYDMRHRMVLDEANVIGTCYLRAGLLADPARSTIRAALRQYTDLRLEHFERALEPGEFDRTTKAMDVAMNQLWSGVEASVAASREMAHTSLIISAANDVIDSSSTRDWAGRNHMPVPVFYLLAVCMIVSAGLMGHSSGQTLRRHIGLWIALNILITMVLFVILDLDRPRRGLIQMNHRPLLQLRESMKGS